MRLRGKGKVPKIMASADVSLKRYRLCKECHSFQPKLARCAECGCLMKLKVKLKDATCPLGKW